MEEPCRNYSRTLKRHVGLFKSLKIFVISNSACNKESNRGEYSLKFGDSL